MNKLRSQRPPQVQMVWDNINLRTKHRYERKHDDYSKNNFDWMASLWIKDRIDVSHMQSENGCTLKDVEQIKIEDFVPSKAELDYVFGSMVAHYSSQLIKRHPNIFKSLNSSITQVKPHQFSHAMSQRSTEYTGDLFTKSESRMEDLISMMNEVQKNVATYQDDSILRCHERKIVSGDNKTEKNMHHGILRER